MNLYKHHLLKMQEYLDTFETKAYLHYSVSVEDICNAWTKQNQYHIRYFIFPDFLCENGKFTKEQIQRICEGYQYVHVSSKSGFVLYLNHLAQPDYCVYKQGRIHSPELEIRFTKDPAFDANVYYEYLRQKYKGIYTIEHGTSLTCDFFNIIPLPKGALKT
jgi:hypothetical protein